VPDPIIPVEFAPIDPNQSLALTEAQHAVNSCVSALHGKYPTAHIVIMMLPGPEEPQEICEKGLLMVSTIPDDVDNANLLLSVVDSITQRSKMN
jgi:hypothetical protein